MSKSKSQQDTYTFTWHRPKEGDRDFEVLNKLFCYLKEEGELSFDPPFVARPPSGERSKTMRGLYLMVEGLEALEKKYPKRKGAVSSAAVEDAPAPVANKEKQSGGVIF